jgi:hypothetical protein
MVCKQENSPQKGTSDEKYKAKDETEGVNKDDFSLHILKLNLF